MTLKELLKKGKVSLARLPRLNDYLFDIDGKIHYDRLDGLKAYSVPIISHDYVAKTPIMWNTLYQSLGLNIRNIMVVANPKDTKEILLDLKSDPKYIGGGAGVGFKEFVIPYLDRLEPTDLQAVNIIVKEGNSLVGYNTDAKGFILSLEEALLKAKKDIKGSNFVVYGAGGVSREVTKLLAQKGANHIAIVNRTYKKAVELASFLNQTYGQVAIGVGEHISRGVVLNSEVKVDALINLSDKGSDGPLESVAMYESAHDKNETLSRNILRELKNLRPDVLIADIVLSKSGKSISLRLAENAGIKNLLDGTPMVINQAAPAYILIQDVHKDIHSQKVTEQQALEIFRKATQS